jgi:hypothetical protein
MGKTASGTDGVLHDPPEAFDGRCQLVCDPTQPLTILAYSPL